MIELSRSCARHRPLLIDFVLFLHLVEPQLQLQGQGLRLLIERSAQAPATTQNPQPAPDPSPTPSPEPVAPVLTPNPVASVKAAQPLPPPLAQPVAPALDPAIAYNAKLAAAVQAAFEVPATATALNFKGRTRVEFNLLDGVVSAIRVVQSSGLGASDRAALKAVQTAAFPPPPPALQGNPGTYQIWVACL